MKQVITKDGTVTYYNEEAREHYHTLTGAMEEAELKHLAPAKDFVKENGVIIDFCFGLGYNSIATLAYAKQKGIKNITVVCFENDLGIIKQLNDFNLDEKYEPFRKLFLKMIAPESKQESKETYDYYETEEDGYKVILYLGDAKELISKCEPKGDIIYFDPFSRGKLPEFWTEEIFEKVYMVLNTPAILTTYSCSKAVRKNMEAAGLRYEDGPVVGRKAPGTIAFKE